MEYGYDDPGNTGFFSGCFPGYEPDASFVSMTGLIIWRGNGKGFVLFQILVEPDKAFTLQPHVE